VEFYRTKGGVRGRERDESGKGCLPPACHFIPIDLEHVVSECVAELQLMVWGLLFQIRISVNF
jgi:hypothetical protein